MASSRELRQFGLILAAFFALLFGGAMPWLGWLTFHAWLWGAAAVLILLALAAPRALEPVYVVWTTLGRGLGWINTRVLLGVVFFAVILPLGAILRALGLSTLPKSKDPSLDTYRITRRELPAVDHFERPY